MLQSTRRFTPPCFSLEDLLSQDHWATSRWPASADSARRHCSGQKDRREAAMPRDESASMPAQSCLCHHSELLVLESKVVPIFEKTHDPGRAQPACRRAHIFAPSAASKRLGHLVRLQLGLRHLSRRIARALLTRVLSRATAICLLACNSGSGSRQQPCRTWRT